MQSALFQGGKNIFQASKQFNTLHTVVYGAVAKGGRDLKYVHFWMQPVYGIL